MKGLHIEGSIRKCSGRKMARERERKSKYWITSKREAIVLDYTNITYYFVNCFEAN